MTRRDLRPKRTEFDRWEDYFEPGEHLIWQAAPVPGVRFHPGYLFLSAFGLPFLAAGVFTASMGLTNAFSAQPDLGLFGGIFMLFFSLPFISVGLGLVFGPWIAGPIAARRTRYALTNRRAYIAKNYLTRNLETYVIHADDPITLERGKRADSVYFHAKHGRDSDGDRTTQKIGFEHIEDGEAVYTLLRDIQRNDRDEG